MALENLPQYESYTHPEYTQSVRRRINALTEPA